MTDEFKKKHMLRQNITFNLLLVESKLNSDTIKIIKKGLDNYLIQRMFKNRNIQTLPNKNI